MSITTFNATTATFTSAVATTSAILSVTNTTLPNATSLTGLLIPPLSITTQERCPRSLEGLYACGWDPKKMLNIVTQCHDLYVSYVSSCDAPNYSCVYLRVVDATGTSKVFNSSYPLPYCQPGEKPTGPPTSATVNVNGTTIQQPIPPALSSSLKITAFIAFLVCLMA